MKDCILFVDHVSQEVISGIRAYGARTNQPFRVIVLRDSKRKSWQERAQGIGVDALLTCDLSNPLKIEKALLPYKDHIVALTCRSESAVHWLAKVVPHVPYVRTPSSQSLLWSTDKIMMRELFQLHDKQMTPRFLVISDHTPETIKIVKEKVGFPLVLKPAGLAQSLLVSVCFHEEEFERTLKKVLRKVEKVYRDNKRTVAPKILVEEFMEGELYSVDAYVTSRGRISFCPLVHVKTGRAIGFDDFFGYQRMVPTTLSKEEIEHAEGVAGKSVRALGLRSTTAHVELLKTDTGWKIVEVGPRIGGFRHQLYQLSHGIDHSLNDVLLRMGKPVEIPKKAKGYAVALQFYAKKEGRLTGIKGIKKIQSLTSFVEVRQHKNVGDMCRFAKHGGRSVCNVVLFHEKRSDLFADIRRVEQSIFIETE